MKVLFVEYPQCSTCQKAKAWLVEHGVEFEDRHILEDTPTAHELAAWKERGDLPLKKLWNTSGMLYKSMHLKDSLPAMGEREQLELLSGNGMLIKRPLLVGGEFVLAGFRPDQWEQALLVR